MAQNVYDRPDFFEGYSQLSRSVEGLAGAPEWPSLRAMLPDVCGLKVVDLGCGLWLVLPLGSGQGAAEVLGLDLSEKMLAKARADTPDGAAHRSRSAMWRMGPTLCRYLPSARSGRAPSVLDGAPDLHGVDEAELASRRRRLEDMAAGPDSVEGPRTTDWLSFGVVKHHRTIGTTLNLLIGAGFQIRHVEEFCPTPEQITATPSLAEEVERPMFLLVSAQR